MSDETSPITTKDYAPRAAPWWLRLGHERPRPTAGCPHTGCKRPQACDLFCATHEEQVLFRAARCGSGTWLAVNLLRAGVVAAFLATAQWSTPFPVLGCLVALGMAFVGLPLRAYRIGLRFALATMALATVTAVVVMTTRPDGQARHVIATVVLTAAGLGWIVYTLTVATWLARQEPHSHATSKLATAATATTLAGGPVALVGWWALSRQWADVFVVAPSALRQLLFGGFVGSFATAGVTGAIVGLVSSAGAVDRQVRPALRRVRRPKPLEHPARKTRPEDHGARTGFDQLTRFFVAGLARLGDAAMARGRDVANFVLQVGYRTLDALVRLVNWLHATVVRLARRIAESGRRARDHLRAGGKLACKIGVRYAATFAGPAVAAAVAVLVGVIAADATTAYLDDGPLFDLLRLAGAGLLALGLLFLAWGALIDVDLRAAARSQALMALLGGPRLLVLFVAICWLVGLPGTLGYGPIRVGELTIVSTVVLAVAVIASIRRQRSGGEAPATQ